MYTTLLILLLIDCFGLVVAVLLQAGKGGGLAAGFGGAGTGMEMMGSRQTVTFLHSATKWLGGAFLVICFVLSLLTVRGAGNSDPLRRQRQARQRRRAPHAARRRRGAGRGSEPRPGRVRRHLRGGLRSGRLTLSIPAVNL